MLSPVTSCCHARPLRPDELAPALAASGITQCSECWGPAPRLVDPIAELERALDHARDLRFPRSAHGFGPEMDPEPHGRAVNLLCGAASDLAAAAGGGTMRRLLRACQRAVGVLVASGRRDELETLLEAGELLDVALRAELAALRRAAA